MSGVDTGQSVHITGSRTDSAPAVICEGGRYWHFTDYDHGSSLEHNFQSRSDP